MLGLYHEFFLINQEDYDYEGYKKFYNNKNESLSFEDFIYRYIIETLKWIPTYNPSTKKNGLGLNSYGVTIIKKEGSIMLDKILRGWIQIFSCIPTKSIILTGSWYSVDKKTSLVQFEKEKLKKEEILFMLQQLQQYCKKVNSSENNYILHFGI